MHIPHIEAAPVIAIGRRLLLAVSMLLLVVFVAYLDREGYRDTNDDSVSLLDCFYYATVSITTTGYGDVVPASDRARLVTTLVTTPARVLFLIVLVGTTLEVLTERTREGLRVTRWRRRVRDHVIICGFGTKGRSAAAAVVGQGTPHDRVVVIEPDSDARADASEAGFVTIAGNASRTSVLRQAEVELAAAVIVAANADETAVLITLTARELNPNAVITVAVRESENAHLLQQGGADSVITSSAASGRLLGLATARPRAVAVIEDLLVAGGGLDVEERAVRAEEIGHPLRGSYDELVLAVLRNGALLPFADRRCAVLEAGDHLVVVVSHDGEVRGETPGGSDSGEPVTDRGEVGSPRRR